MLCVIELWKKKTPLLQFRLFHYFWRRKWKSVRKVSSVKLKDTYKNLFFSLDKEIFFTIYILSLVNTFTIQLGIVRPWRKRSCNLSRNSTFNNMQHFLLSCFLFKNWKGVGNIISACEIVSNTKPLHFQDYKNVYIHNSPNSRKKDKVTLWRKYFYFARKSFL